MWQFDYGGGHQPRIGPVHTPWCFQAEYFAAAETQTLQSLQSLPTMSDPLSPAPVERKERTFLFGIKKFMASAFAASSTGQDVLKAVLPSEAVALLVALEAVTTLHSNAEQAQEFSDILYKLILKVRLLQSEGYLDPPQIEHTFDPLLMLLRQLLSTLSRSVPGDPERPIRFNEVQSTANRVAFIIVDLLEPLISTKNIANLRRLLAYWGGTDFLEFFFNDIRSSSHRSTILHSMQVLLAPLVVEFAIMDNSDSSQMKAQPCIISHCPRNRAVRTGDFRGSELCVEHHVEAVRDIIDHPTLHLFMGDHVALGIFNHFITAHSDQYSDAVRNALHFLRAVQPFREYEKGLRISRAKLLVDNTAPMKFLDEEHSYTFRSDIQDNIDRGSRDLFDAVSAFAASLIQPSFQDFIATAHFRAWATTMAPSASLMRRLRIRPLAFSLNNSSHRRESSVVSLDTSQI